MDAKPQRPVRGVPQSDENVLGRSTQQPTAHQRHKSTGMLPNMSSMGSFKGGAKRTALYEVSNTSKYLASVQESAGPAGKNVNDTTKPLPVAEKAATLHRPAQRPLNILKVFPESVTDLPSTNAHPPNSLGENIPPVAVRQAPVKPNATKLPIYHDNAEVAEQHCASQSAKETDSADQLPKESLAAPIHQDLGLRRNKSQPELKYEQPELRRTRSTSLSEGSAKLDVTVPDNSHDAVEQSINDGTEDYYRLSYMKIMDQQLVEESVLESKAVQQAMNNLHRQLPIVPMNGEVEENWEEEDVEGGIYYEPGGYTATVTLGNTTGTLTTNIVPTFEDSEKQQLAEAKAITESLLTQEDIDDDRYDVTMVAEYGEDIFKHLICLEKRMLPNRDYMTSQNELQWSMRSVLMDWIVQVHSRFSLLPETLFLCVNVIDRFLSLKVVSTSKLQLVGATALFVAAKYEEINCPSINEMVYMVDGGYQQDEIMKAERYMLSMLDYELGWPGPMSFLRRVSKADEYDLETRTVAKYFMEVTIMDERFVGSPASFIAAASHAFARVLLKKGEWSHAHIHYSGYTWGQLRPLVRLIASCCVDPTKHHSAVFEKYSASRYKKASMFVQEEFRQGFYLPPTRRPALPVQPSRGPRQSYEELTAGMPSEVAESFRRMIQVTS